VLQFIEYFFLFFWEVGLSYLYDVENLFSENPPQISLKSRMDLFVGRVFKSHNEKKPSLKDGFFVQ
jgi:hypothetical protein